MRPIGLAGPRVRDFRMCGLCKRHVHTTREGRGFLAGQRGDDAVLYVIGAQEYSRSDRERRHGLAC
jgi:hypothetical protein